MKTTRRARRRLRRHWGSAIAVQLLVLGGGAILPLAEWLALRLLGDSGGAMLLFSDLLQGKHLQAAAVIGGMVLLDLLLTSPLQLGQARYYTRLAAGTPDRPGTLWRDYRGSRYFRAVRYRLCIWGIQVLTGLLTFAPAALVLALGDTLRKQAENGEDVVLLRLFAGMLGLLTLVVGFLLMELFMLKFLPVPYYLAADRTLSVRKAIARSWRQTRGQVGTLAWRYVRFVGWGLCCILLVPYFYVAPLFQTSRAMWVEALEPKDERVKVYVPPVTA